MFLKSLYLKNFKKFKELKLEFPADLTVIKGSNEKGKTTVAGALVAGLFYDAKKDNEAIRELQSWRSPESCVIKICFEENGGDWELTRDFQSKENGLTDKNGGKTINNHKEISELLYAMGGYRNAALFSSTGWVKQETINEIGSGKKEIEEALQDLVTSGADNVSALDIIKKLDKAIAELERGLSSKLVKIKNPGIIKSLEEKVQEKREKYAELSGQIKALGDNISKLEKIKREEGETEKNLELTQAEMSAVKQYFSSQEKIEGLNKEIKRLEEDLEIAEEADSRNKDLKIKLKNLKTAKDGGINKTRVNFYLVTAALFASIGFLGFFLNNLFLLGFLAAVVIGWQSWRTRTTKSSLDKAGDNIKMEIEKNQARLEAILKRKKIQDLKEERREMMRQREIEENKIDHSYKQIPPAKKDELRLEREISILSKKKEQLSGEKIRLESSISGQRDYQEEMLVIEESAESLKNQLKYEKEKLEVYKITRNALLEVKEQTISTLKGKLKEYINNFIFEVTGNRYNKAELDDNLNISVHSDEKGGYVEVDKHLSRGTIDQFYLMSRFALLEVLAPNKKPLIILDDPFVNFDQSRRAHAKHICLDLSKRFQILLFTHSDDYDGWGKILKLES